jgi:hypothetical protein
VFLFFLCAGLICLTGALGAAPLALDLEAGDRMLLRARYLCFSGKIPLRDPAASFGTLRLLRDWVPVFRKPLRVSRFQMRLRFSTGEAAETALLYGWLCGLFSSLRPLLAGGKPEIVLGPLFSARRELALNCRVSLAMPAALLLFRIIRRGLYTRRSGAHV